MAPLCDEAYKAYAVVWTQTTRVMQKQEDKNDPHDERGANEKKDKDEGKKKDEDEEMRGDHDTMTELAIFRAATEEETHKDEQPAPQDEMEERSGEDEERRIRLRRRK